MGALPPCNEEEDTVTPLQVQLSKTAKVLSIMVLVIAAVIWASLYGKIHHGRIYDGCCYCGSSNSRRITAVVTLFYHWWQRMSARKAMFDIFPRGDFRVCEVICSDKTGTLTSISASELFTPTVGPGERRVLNFRRQHC